MDSSIFASPLFLCYNRWYIFLHLCTMLYIIYTILTIVILCTVFLCVFRFNLSLLEKKIISHFQKRSDLIPSLFEITKPYLNRHSEIFNETLNLRIATFWEYYDNRGILQMLLTQKKLHNELNFIFTLCNKHPSFLKHGNFIYLRELIIHESYEIWKYIQIYNHATKMYNNYIFWKNFSIIWVIIPFGKIQRI